jgi:hypothetical protein
MGVTNNLAYCNIELITTVKIFTAEAPVAISNNYSSILKFELLSCHKNFTFFRQKIFCCEIKVVELNLASGIFGNIKPTRTTHL